MIGASPGEVTALQQLVSGFQADLPAAVFITMHVFSRSEALLPDLLNKVGLCGRTWRARGDQLWTDLRRPSG